MSKGAMIMNLIVLMAVNIIMIMMMFIFMELFSVFYLILIIFLKNYKWKSFSFLSVKVKLASYYCFKFLMFFFILIFYFIYMYLIMFFSSLEVNFIYCLFSLGENVFIMFSDVYDYFFVFKPFSVLSGQEKDLMFIYCKDCYDIEFSNNFLKFCEEVIETPCYSEYSGNYKYPQPEVPHFPFRSSVSGYFFSKKMKF